MKRIGITGPTGAGKTTVLNALKALGAHIIDCDAVYHELLERSEPLRQALADRFGTEILNQQGRVERKRLGTIVFGDPAALADLNAITHRFVQAEVDAQCTQAERRGCPAVGIDAIALIESGLGQTCDAVVGVLAPPEVRVQRIMAREGISEEYARQRVKAQKEDAFFRDNCDHIINNDGDAGPEQVQQRALALFRTIIEKN